MSLQELLHEAALAKGVSVPVRAIVPQPEYGRCREEFIEFLRHKPVYHYGIRMRAGHNTGGIPYEWEFGSSVFIEALRDWINEFDALVKGDSIIGTLCNSFNRAPNQPALVHNLGMLFLPAREQELRQLMNDYGRFATLLAGQREPDPPGWPPKTTLEQRLAGLTYAERFVVMWEKQDDAKLYRRYLGKVPGGNAAEILKAMRGVDLNGPKGKRLIKTLLHSPEPEWRSLGRLLQA